MSARFDHSPEFARLVRGDEHADLATIALEIARDAAPALDPHPFLARLDDWADRVRSLCQDGGGILHILAQINRVLFIEEQLKATTDPGDDPAPSLLNDVIETRLGAPVSLSILYIAIADRIGLALAGAALPGPYFLVRTQRATSELFIDPCHNGALLDRKACAARIQAVTGHALKLRDSDVAPCPTSATIARLLESLKHAYLLGKNYRAATTALRRLVALPNPTPQQKRDLASACLKSNQPNEALRLLESEFKRAGSRPDPQLKALLSEARARAAELN